MKKNLPRINTFPIEKNIQNQKTFFYGNETRSIEKKKTIPIEIKINRIFNSTNYIFKKDVTIVTSNGTFEKTIIGKNGKYLLTSDNQKVNISDIIDIY